MNKYEIMLVVDPAIDSVMATELVESVFGKKNIVKADKLEQTTLAYPINKSTKAQYMLYLLNAERSVISEFIRKSNITKFIWRHLVINLDTEKGYEKSKKPRKNVISKEAKVAKSANTKKIVETINKISKSKTEKSAQKVSKNSEA
ncbi:30S ribosomal protein S6 [Mycoplasmopsis felifaucium]|uniref:Small ribosomal subunit protein bS6 n=1 Tax=Mycoplasmopsis felifaucium TaxID=35768 RepID=A0ABZ2RR20_9BACT